MKKLFIFTLATVFFLFLIQLREVEPGRTHQNSGSHEASQQLAVTPNHSAGGVATPSNNRAEFSEWLTKWRQADYEVPDPAFLQRGIESAHQRQKKMESLIESDPNEALKKALSYFEYEQLPEPVQALVEEPFSEVSDIQVTIHCGAHSSHTRYAYRAPQGNFSKLYMPENHRVHLSKRSIPMQGIRLNQKAVVRGNVFQIVKGREARWLTQEWPSGQEDSARCFFTGEPLTAPAVTAVAGGRVFQFKDTAKVEELETILAKADAQPGLDNGSGLILRPRLMNGASEGFAVEAFQSEVARATLSHTTGNKTILVIQVDFPNLQGRPFDPSMVEDVLDNDVDSALNRFSYGALNLQSVVTDYALRTLYNHENYNSGSGYDALHDEIVAKYRSLGNPDPFMEFDFVCIAFREVGYAFGGRAAVGGQKLWINDDAEGHTFTHELGHNLGLVHANYWNFSATDAHSSDPVDPSGANEEYGDLYDNMGTGVMFTNLESHYHMPAKQYLGWLLNDDWIDVQPSSLEDNYRLFRFDDIDADGLQALRIRKSATNDYYWLGYRHTYKGNPFLPNGAYLLWERGSQNPGRNQSWLIDTTPGSEFGKQDAAVAVGKTYSDFASNVHITPTAKGGSSPREYLDVVINFGPFPGNSSPDASFSAPSTVSAREAVSLQAVANDPDGDPLAYHWDMGDESSSENSPSVMHSWTVGGSYEITLTVSDMKGGVTTHAKTVTVEDPLNTWHERSSGTQSAILGAASNETHAVAVGAGGVLLRSVDGVDWLDVAPVQLPSGTFFQDVIWSGSEFYAVGASYDPIIEGFNGVIYKSSTGRNWTLDHEIPSGRTENAHNKNTELLGIAMNEQGTVVCIGRAATVLRKPENGVWVSIQTSVTSTHELRDIAYGNGWFIFVGHSTTPSYNGDVAVFRSSDGLIWEDLSAAPQLATWQDFRKISFLENAFYASGFHSAIRTSSDQGQNWTLAQTAISDYEVQAFAHSDEIYYAVGFESGDPSTDVDLISTDGVRWTKIFPGDLEDRREVIEFNNTFITVGNNGTIRQSEPLEPGNTPPSGTISGVTQTDARQLNLFNAEASDADGDDLTYVWDMGDGSDKPNSASVTHRWLTGGSYNVKLTISDRRGGYTEITQIVTVSDPLNDWTERNSGTASALLGIAANQTHVVAVGVSGRLLRSSDGATWTDVAPANLPGNTNFQDVVWTGSKFYAVGGHYDFSIGGWNGIIYGSETGQNWTLEHQIPAAETALVHNKNSELLGIASDGDTTLVCVGRAATVLQKNGLNQWASIETNVPDSHVIEDIAFGDGYFVFVGGDSGFGEAFVLRSNNGLDWNDVSGNIGLEPYQDFREIEFVDGAFYTSGNFTRAHHSNDGGLTWSPIQTDNFHKIEGFAATNGIFYGVGDESVSSNPNIDLISLDGLNWTSLRPGNVEKRTEIAAFKNTFISVGRGGSIRQSNTIPNHGGYQAFAEEYFPGEELHAKPTANPDLDWASNLLEYALGGNPNSSVKVPKHPSIYFDESGRAVFEITREKKRPDIAYSVWWSPDLITWKRSGLTVFQDTANSFKVRTNQSIDTQKSGFFKLKIDQ